MNVKLKKVTKSINATGTKVLGKKTWKEFKSFSNEVGRQIFPKIILSFSVNLNKGAKDAISSETNLRDMYFIAPKPGKELTKKQYSHNQKELEIISANIFQFNECLFSTYPKCISDEWDINDANDITVNEIEKFIRTDMITKCSALEILQYVKMTVINYCVSENKIEYVSKVFC